MKSSNNSSPSSWPDKPRRILSVEQRLQRAEDPGYRAEHAGFGAVADHAVGDGVRPKAAQAGVARLRLVDLQLAFVLVDAGEDCGPAREHRGVVDQELGAKIVAAIDHDVVARDQRERVVGVEAHGVCFDVHGRVDSLDAPRLPARPFVRRHPPRR